MAGTLKGGNTLTWFKENNLKPTEKQKDVNLKKTAKKLIKDMKRKGTPIPPDQVEAIWDIVNRVKNLTYEQAEELADRYDDPKGPLVIGNFDDPL